MLAHQQAFSHLIQHIAGEMESPSKFQMAAINLIKVFERQNFSIIHFRFDVPSDANDRRFIQPRVKHPHTAHTQQTHEKYVRTRQATNWPLPQVSLSVCDAKFKWSRQATHIESMTRYIPLKMCAPQFHSKELSTLSTTTTMATTEANPKYTKSGYGKYTLKKKKLWDGCRCRSMNIKYGWESASSVCVCAVLTVYYCVQSINKYAIWIQDDEK